MGLSAHTFVLARSIRILNPVRLLSALELTSPPSRQSLPSHRGTESARIGFDAVVRVHLSTFASYNIGSMFVRSVIARRSSPRIEHRGRGLLLCIAIAPASPHGDVFAISPLAERNFWSRTRARSHGQELIAQPSSTTSRTRRCFLCVPWPSTPCGMKSSVPQPPQPSVLEAARKLLVTFRCSAPCTRPRTRVPARSRASLPDHLSMTGSRARVFEHVSARGGARPCSPSNDLDFAWLSSMFSARSDARS